MPSLQCEFSLRPPLHARDRHQGRRALSFHVALIELSPLFSSGVGERSPALSQARRLSPPYKRAGEMRQATGAKAEIRFLRREKNLLRICIVGAA